MKSMFSKSKNKKSKAKNISTFDFNTLYTTITCKLPKKALSDVIEFVFLLIKAFESNSLFHVDVTKHANIMEYQGSFIIFVLTIKDENKYNLPPKYCNRYRSIRGVKGVSTHKHTHTHTHTHTYLHTYLQTQENFEKIFLHYFA